MDFQTFLNLLENTLEEIRVAGRQDTERMFSIYQAIDRMRGQIAKGGEQDGRQVDKPADSGDAGI